MINCDSQAAIKAISSTVIKSSTTLEATMALNTLHSFIPPEKGGGLKILGHAIYVGGWP